MNQSNQYLATESIGKLMLKFSVPCIVSLLVSALYNIVDQIFIGRGIGYLGNGATNVVFPITIITLSLALLAGDGCAAFLSLCQGKNDVKSAHKSVGNLITLIVACGIILTVIFALLRDTILLTFGATENNMAYAQEYFHYIIMGIPFFMFANALNSVIRADGSPKFAMISTFIGCIINVILDPIAIFVLDWGMMGAAVATIIGQIVSALLTAYYMFNPKSFCLKKDSFIIKIDIITKFLPLGISSFLTQVSIVLVMAVMNNVLVHYGAISKYGADIPLTVMGIVMKVFQIVISVVVGIAAGCQPIIGYNYGAGLNHRVKEIFKTMMTAEIIIGIVATVVFELFPIQIISIFGSESQLYNEFAVMTFRIYLSTIILCCFHKSAAIFLQALGRPILSMGASLLREFVLCVPLIYLLPKAFGLKSVLLAAPISDIITTIFVLFILRYVFNNLIIKSSDCAQKNEKVMCE